MGYDNGWKSNITAAQSAPSRFETLSVGVETKADAEPISEVDSELRDLSMVTSNIWNAISELEDRLRPIFSAYPVEDSAKTAGRPELSPLATAIYDQRQFLSQSLNRLDELRRRLAI